MDSCPGDVLFDPWTLSSASLWSGDTRSNAKQEPDDIVALIDKVFATRRNTAEAAKPTTETLSQAPMTITWEAISPMPGLMLVPAEPLLSKRKATHLFDDEHVVSSDTRTRKQSRDTSCADEVPSASTHSLQLDLGRLCQCHEDRKMHATTALDPEAHPETQNASGCSCSEERDQAKSTLLETNPCTHTNTNTNEPEPNHAYVKYLDRILSDPFSTSEGQPCAFCPEHRLYFRRHDLARHIKTSHICERPFPCDVCFLKFKRRSHRDMHIKSVHEKCLSFTCIYCNRIYSSDSTRRKHCRIAHNTTIYD